MSQNNSSGGIGFGGALLILFVALKLCEVINWSWWLVLAPMWIPLSIGAVLLAILGICALIEESNRKARRR